jgi:hypothetical protein
MNADIQDVKYKELMDRIIKIFYRVYNKLGYGFLEKVYENAMAEESQAQLLNYLKATNVEIGLLLNFGSKAEFKRKAFDNRRK